MVWFYERQGTFIRCETRVAASGGFELVVIQPDGSERVEHFDDSATLARAITKTRADFYSELTASRNEGVVDMLGQLTLFGDNPARINHIEDEFRSVTSERVLSVAREYLRPENRTVLLLNMPEAK